MKMNAKELSESAKAIRCRIKELIPELSARTTEHQATIVESENGVTTYGGPLLAEQVISLIEELPISDIEVRFLLTWWMWDLRLIRGIELGLACGTCS